MGLLLVINWKDISTGLLVGAIIGIAGTFWTFNSRITRLEAGLELGDMNGKPVQGSIAGTKKDTEEKKAGKIIFNETFDDNILGWSTYSNEVATKSISDGKYIIANKVAGADRWGTVTANNLPGNFDITLCCNFISGNEKEEFGIILLQNQFRSYRFNITRNGYASVGFMRDSIWQPEILMPRAGFKKPSIDPCIRLRVEVRGERFRYYANDMLVGEGFLNEVFIKEFGVFVTDLQTIAFDELTVTEIES